MGETIADATTTDALGRGVWTEDGHTQKHGFGRFLRSGHEGPDLVGRMLAVGIHDEAVSESGGCGGFHGREDRSAFAAIGWQVENVQTALFPGETLDFFYAFIGAAIENDPNWTPDGEDGPGGFHQERSAVETGQNDEMGGIGQGSWRGQKAD